MLETFLSVFVTFFVVIDPPGVAPLFASLTSGQDKNTQRKTAFKAVFIAALIFLCFAFAGKWLLSMLGISLDSFKISGGILLFVIAIEMLFEKRTKRRDETADKAATEAKAHPERHDDVAVFPLAIPLLAGPGSIASIMLHISQSENLNDKMIVLSGVGVNLVLCLIVFLLAGKITKIMGPTLATVIERLLGIILAALAAQFVIDGLKGAFLI